MNSPPTLPTDNSYSISNSSPSFPATATAEGTQIAGSFLYSAAVGIRAVSGGTFERKSRFPSARVTGANTLIGGLPSWAAADKSGMAASASAAKMRFIIVEILFRARAEVENFFQLSADFKYLAADFRELGVEPLCARDEAV